MTQVQNVEILKVGRALVEGVRGANGGAPSKDSIWGVAKVAGNVVKFYGRRGGVLRYKTERRTELDAALAKFEAKVAGKDGKDYEYVELTPAQQEELVPGLPQIVKTGYYKAMGTGKLNTRSTKKPAKTAA